MKLVLVEWEDASIADDGPWVLRSEAKEPKARIFKQVGWLVSLDADAIVLTCAADDDLMAARDRIPRGMVLSVHEIDPAAGKRLRLPKARR